MILEYRIGLTIEEEGKRVKRNIVMGLIGVLFVLIVGSYSIFYQSQRPIVQAESEAAAIAEQVGAVQKVEDFFWYNGTDATYFAVSGYTDADKLVYVVIKQDGGQTWVFDSNEIVTEDEAKAIVQAVENPVSMLEARIGIDSDEPFWEVAFKDANGKLGYYQLSAKTGQKIKEFKNI